MKQKVIRYMIIALVMIAVILLGIGIYFSFRLSEKDNPTGSLKPSPSSSPEEIPLLSKNEAEEQLVSLYQKEGYYFEAGKEEEKVYVFYQKRKSDDWLFCTFQVTKIEGFIEQDCEKIPSSGGGGAE